MITIIVKSKKFVSNHKTAIAVLLTATACYKIHSTAVAGWNEFLTQHDLFEEFYPFNTEV